MIRQFSKKGNQLSREEQKQISGAAGGTLRWWRCTGGSSVNICHATNPVLDDCACFATKCVAVGTCSFSSCC